VSRIDWRELLTERRIPFIEAGANVRRGEANIRCPYCGSADPSFHMGISLETGWWSCWRNRREHSGKSPVRLLMKLLHVGHAEALSIAGLDASYVDPDGFSAMAARLRRDRADTAPAEVKEADALCLDRGFERLVERGPMRRHWGYLDGRWFDPDQLREDYGVCCGVGGMWHNRIILPYIEEGNLVTWTGRAIGNAEIRYKDLPLRPKEGYTGELARTPAKETLYNHDAMCNGGRWLILQEGPFDALKLDCYGKEFEVRSVALSTASISDEQIARLDVYARNFDHLGVMMDNAKMLDLIDSMRMKSQLRGIHPSAHILPVPFGRKDGAELKPREVRRFCEDLTTTKH
jgi:hypothetical protein